jgi:hypothetical protein
LLLLVFFTGNAGYYIFFAYQQHELKEAMEIQLLAAVPDSCLNIIVAEQNPTFRWEEESKEFYQDGQMYDVIKTVVKNNKTVLYCVNDKKEAQLLLQLSKASGHHNGKGEKQSNKIQVIDLYCQSMRLAIKSHLLSGKLYTHSGTDAITPVKEVNAPPPRA